MKADILVAGAGPVGLLGAGLCAKAGWRVALVSPQPPMAAFDCECEPLARVVALAPEILAALSGVIPDPPWRERSCPVQCMQVSVPQAGAIEFQAADFGAPILAQIVEVPALQAALERWVEELGVRRVPEAVVAYQPGEVELDSGARIQAPLVLACDGAESRLRSLAGLNSQRRDYQQSAIVARLRFEQAPGQVARQSMSTTGILGALPLADGSISVVWSVPAARAQELMQLTASAFAGQLAAGLGDVWGEAELLGERVSFPLRHIASAALHAPGLALLGDAAHSLHPLAGLGLNLGLADALRLAQSLEAGQRAGRRLDDSAVLRRWGSQRQAAVAPYQRFVDALAGIGPEHPVAWQGVGQGFALVDQIARIKRFFAQQAMTGSL